jgi:hypothetical protein
MLKINKKVNELVHQKEKIDLQKPTEKKEEEKEDHQDKPKKVVFLNKVKYLIESKLQIDHLVNKEKELKEDSKTSNVELKLTLNQAKEDNVSMTANLAWEEESKTITNALAVERPTGEPSKTKRKAKLKPLKLLKVSRKKLKKALKTRSKLKRLK